MTALHAPAAARSKRIRLGVDFHVWDELFQGSRSHLLGLYRAAIPLAPDIDFVFFLDQPDALRRAHPEFDAPHVHLVRMPHRPGPWRLAWQLPWLRRRPRASTCCTCSTGCRCCAWGAAPAPSTTCCSRPTRSTSRAPSSGTRG
ncbi:MAG: hypothetical protein U5L74_07845 [Ideonella sp.]|nr:hypothetical protein [Ideonella sp.]